MRQDETGIRHQVGVVVRGDDDNWLVLKRNPDHYYGWGLIQGGIDQGEHFLDAVVREVKEEIGVSIEKEQVKNLGYVSVHQDESNNRVAMVTWFKIVLPIDSLQNLKLQDDEWLEAKLVSFQQAQKLLTHESQKTAMGKAQGCDLETK